ncbi:MAG: hypothetical protein K6B65_03410 [Bacilli bacterium]|nr:hypothetical protein [Bacilli bacterium]
MDAKDYLDLRKTIEEKRALFPCVKPYQRIHGIASSLEREKGEEAREYLEMVYRYVGGMEDLIRLESSKAVVDASCVKPIVYYSLESSLDNDYEEYQYLLPLLLSYQVGLGKNIEEEDEIHLLWAVVNLHKKESRVWRGKPYAKLLFEFATKRPIPKEAYSSLSSFYKSVLDYRSAKEIALLGAKALYETDRKSSAYLYRDALASGIYLEEEPPKQEEVKSLYEEYGEFVLSYPNLASMKLDPIMNSERFQNIYDEAMEEAMESYERNGVMIVMALWLYMEESFAKRGILWRSPATMNPFVRFD